MGLTEGTVDGMAVGTVVDGLAEGSVDGMAEGLTEGSVDGIAVGLNEGSVVGLKVEAGAERKLLINIIYEYRFPLLQIRFEVLQI